MRQAAWVLMLAVVAAAGCTTVNRGRFANPSTFSGTDAETAEAVAARVLRQLRFEPVIPRKSEGHIETLPVTGASWFEFWRKDTIGRRQVAEASLHTVRRRAEVSISPSDGGGSKVFVRVVKERASAPDATADSFGATISVHNVEETDLRRRDALEETDYEWLPLGRDQLLEQDILQRIQRALE